MQYSYARVRGIFEKAGVTRDEALVGATGIQLDAPEERALGMALLRFAEALDKVAEDYRPNHLTAYLFELASAYASFFQNCPVIKADTPESRTSRLALCALTARTLEVGLGLLGIECVERM
jgi:arginyl-tRNA synthetase